MNTHIQKSLLGEGDLWSPPVVEEMAEGVEDREEHDSVGDELVEGDVLGQGDIPARRECMFNHLAIDTRQAVKCMTTWHNASR